MSGELNPYQPPRSEVVAGSQPRPIVLASRWRRFGTLLVDYACFWIVSLCLGIFIGIVFGRSGVEALQALPELAYGLVLVLGYYITFEGLWGRTPGKLVFGTVVVDLRGGKPSLRQIVIRTLCRIIPFEPFSFFGKNGWHDSIPDTHVVLMRPPPGAQPAKPSPW